MAEIHKSMTIDAPAERVFDLLDDPSAIASYTPNIERVEDVRQSEQRVGDTFRVIYKAVGMTFENGMKGTFLYQVAPQGEQSALTVDVHYELPGGALGKAIDALLLERTNEKTIEKQLDNLRQMAVRPSMSTSEP